MKKSKTVSPRSIVDHGEWTRYQVARYRTNLSVGSMLREFRGLNKVTASSVARWLGVSPGTVSSWESGRSRIPSYREHEFHKAVAQLAEKRKK